MEIKVVLQSVEECLTGRNNEKHYIYTFTPELMFGGLVESMIADFKISTPEKRIYSVGDRYTLMFK